MKRVIYHPPQWAVLVIFIGMSAPHIFATAGAILRRPNRITIAADTLGISGADTPTPTPIHHCKIHVVNKTTLFYFGGFTDDDESNFHPIEIAIASLNTPGTLESRTRKLVEEVRLPLLRAIQRINQDVSEPMKSQIIGRPGETPTQLAVFGIDNRVLIVVTVNFQRIDLSNGKPVDIHADIKRCPGDGCSETGEGWFLLGKQEEAKAAIDKGKFWSNNDDKDVRRLVEIEIAAHPESVGYPIDVLVLSANGTHKWVAPLGLCGCSHQRNTNQKTTEKRMLDIAGIPKT